MENSDIELRPTPIFAFLKCSVSLILAVLLLYLSWKLSVAFIWFSFAAICWTLYRYFHVRQVSYLITNEYIRVSKGIFFKRIDQVELYRVKDYIIMQPPLLQLFRLMNVTLKSTDGENPVLHLTGVPRSNLIDSLRERVQTARKNNRIFEIN